MKRLKNNAKSNTQKACFSKMKEKRVLNLQDHLLNKKLQKKLKRNLKKKRIYKQLFMMINQKSKGSNLIHRHNQKVKH